MLMKPSEFLLVSLGIAALRYLVFTSVAVAIQVRVKAINKVQTHVQSSNTGLY